MQFQAISCKLKSGTNIVVRTAKTSDASSLAELKRSYIVGTNTIPLTLEEYPSNQEKEESLILKYHNSHNSILLVAEHKNQLIGNIDLTGSARLKMKHTATIGMGIREEWRNQGLGRCLIEATIDWAKNDTEIELIWLDVYASNELGYNLYKNTGFIVSGTVKGFFKEEQGYKDKVQMYQHIK